MLIDSDNRSWRAKKVINHIGWSRIACLLSGVDCNHLLRLFAILRHGASLLAHKFITNTTNRDNILWLQNILFQFPAQATDVDIHNVTVGPILTPDRGQQLLAIDGLAR